MRTTSRYLKLLALLVALAAALAACGAPAPAAAPTAAPAPPAAAPTAAPAAAPAAPAAADTANNPFRPTELFEVVDKLKAATAGKTAPSGAKYAFLTNNISPFWT